MQGKKLIIGIVSLITVIIVASFLAGGMGNSEAKEHISLGNKYMEDLDYEQALAEYKTALEIDPDSKKAASGLENASVKYAEESLAGDLSIEECNGLLIILEDSYEAVQKESIENQILKIEQILDEKEEERIVREQKEKIRKEQEERAKREQEEREKREQEEKEKREQEEKEREEQKVENKKIMESLNWQQTDNWVDDLYNRMIAGDREGVFTIMESFDFIEKCEEYKCENKNSAITHYLKTSNGKEIWGILNDDELTIVYSGEKHKEYAAIGQGDYAYLIYLDSGERRCLCGDIVYENDGSSYEWNTDVVWVTWA